MRFGTGITVKDVDAYPAWLATAEACGFELLTTGDSQSLWADPFTTMAMAATITSEPRLAITVSNPVTRHPAVAASAAATIQRASGGRFALGIGSGDSAVRNLGLRPAPLADLEAYVRAVSDLTAGRTAEWQGTSCALHWLDADSAPVPIWMAAEGPRTQRIAGRLADGVVLSNSLTKGAIEIAMANLAIGALEVGRAIDEIEIWHTANLVLAPTESEGIDSVTFALAGTANHFYRFTLDGKGLPEEYHDRIRGLQQEYNSRHHAQDGDQTVQPNAELIDKFGLRELLARRSTIAGPPEVCARRLDEIASNGVENLILSQFVPDRLGWMRSVADEVLTPWFAGHQT